MATRTTLHQHTMEQCIENCTNCHRICLEIAARHFAAGPHPGWRSITSVCCWTAQISAVPVPTS